MVFFPLSLLPSMSLDETKKCIRLCCCCCCVVVQQPFTLLSHSLSKKKPPTDRSTGRTLSMVSRTCSCQQGSGLQSRQEQRTSDKGQGTRDKDGSCVYRQKKPSPDTNWPFTPHLPSHRVCVCFFLFYLFVWSAFTSRPPFPTVDNQKKQKNSCMN